MRVIIEIPNHEFDNDIKNKFQDYFNRVKQDIADGTLCGNYELETTEMFLASFKRMQVLPDNATYGDVIKAMFPSYKFIIDGGWVNIEMEGRYYSFCPVQFWNEPYIEGKNTEKEIVDPFELAKQQARELMLIESEG